MESIDGNVAVKRGSFEVYVETYKDEVTLDIDFDFEGVVYLSLIHISEPTRPY